MNSSSFQDKIVDSAFLEKLFGFLDYCDLFDQMEDVKSILFVIFEIISLSNKILTNFKDLFIQQILPKILKHLSKYSL